MKTSKRPEDVPEPSKPRPEELFTSRYPDCRLKTVQDCSDAHLLIRQTQEQHRGVRSTAWKNQKKAESERTAIREDIKCAQKTAAQDKAKLTEQAEKLEQAYKKLEAQTRLSDEAVRKLEGKCGKAGDSVRFTTKEFDEADRRVREGDEDVKYVQSVREGLERAAKKRDQELEAAKVSKPAAVPDRHKNRLVRSSPSSSSSKVNSNSHNSNKRPVSPSTKADQVPVPKVSAALTATLAQLSEEEQADFQSQIEEWQALKKARIAEATPAPAAVEPVKPAVVEPVKPATAALAKPEEPVQKKTSLKVRGPREPAPTEQKAEQPTHKKPKKSKKKEAKLVDALPAEAAGHDQEQAKKKPKVQSPEAAALEAADVQAPEAVDHDNGTSFDFTYDDL